MKQGFAGRTISWGLGFLLPLVLVWLAVYSFLQLHDDRTLSEAGSRMDFGNVSRGTSFVVMGFGYLGLAALLVGSFFTPLRKSHSDTGIWLQVLGFLLAFCSLAFIVIIAKMI